VGLFIQQATHITTIQHHLGQGMMGAVGRVLEITQFMLMLQMGKTAKLQV